MWFFGIALVVPGSLKIRFSDVSGLWVSSIQIFATQWYRCKGRVANLDRTTSVPYICPPLWIDIRPIVIWYLLWYTLRGRILRPQTIIFLLCLLFNLDIRALIFASTKNLESGPRFSRILTYLIVVDRHRDTDEFTFTSTNLSKIKENKEQVLSADVPIRKLLQSCKLFENLLQSYCVF